MLICDKLVFVSLIRDVDFGAKVTGYKPWDPKSRVQVPTIMV